jgi:glycolate oxidase subunit GlcD
MPMNSLFPKGFTDQVDRELGPDFLDFDPEIGKVYGQDWSGILEPNPSAVAFPRTTEQVSRLLSACFEHGVAVVPSGGRTGLSGGACAAQGELVLSLIRMNALGAIDPATRTVRVQAGAVTEAVHRHCEPQGLTWPVDFASKGSSTVGGNLSTNAGGVRVIRYGNTRAWVQSIELVTPQGEVLELNGELEKNNTGFDLRQLVMGAEGTLGVITSATLKLVPLPKRSDVLFFSLTDMEAVIRLFSFARESGLPVSAFETLSATCYRESVQFFRMKAPIEDRPEAGAYVLLEVEDLESGDSRLESFLEQVFSRSLALDGVLAQNPREARDLWKLREGIAEAVLHQSLVHQHDVSVPVSKLPEFSARIEAQYARDYPEFEVFIFGHIGDGNLHIFIRAQNQAEKEDFLKRCKASDSALFQFVKEFKGSVSAEHGIGLLKKPALPYSRSAAEISLMKGIKHAFDPKGILNPGKLI